MAKNKTSDQDNGRLDLGRNRNIEDPEGELACPTLSQLLLPRFKEGKCTRLGGSLSLRVVGGFFVVRIACPTEQCQTTFTLTSLSQLTERLEAAVQSTSTVWLPDYDSQKRARREAQQ